MCSRDTDFHRHKYRTFFVASLDLTKKLNNQHFKAQAQDLGLGSVADIHFSVCSSSAGVRSKVYEGHNPWHTQYYNIMKEMHFYSNFFHSREIIW